MRHTTRVTHVTRITPRALALAAATALLAPLSTAAAQGVGLGASVGANVPSGGFADAAKTGLVATGFVALRATSSLGVRGELFWSRSDIDNPLVREAGGAVLPSTGVGGTTGNVDLVGAAANATVGFGTSVLQPYLIGGVGVYRRRVSQDVSGTVSEFRHLRDSDTDFGWNGGAGVRLSLGGVSVFAEARYHAVSTAPERTTFVPVTVGVEF